MCKGSGCHRQRKSVSPPINHQGRVTTESGSSGALRCVTQYWHAVCIDALEPTSSPRTWSARASLNQPVIRPAKPRVASPRAAKSMAFKCRMDPRQSRISQSSPGCFPGLNATAPSKRPAHSFRWPGERQSDVSSCHHPDKLHHEIGEDADDHRNGDRNQQGMSMLSGASRIPVSASPAGRLPKKAL